jgi:hypothetical protein
VGILALSFGMYLGAFAAPYQKQGWFHCGFGFQVFLAGLLLCWLPHLTFAWWSNVLYWVALRHFSRGRWISAAKWGLVATGLGMAWLLIAPEVVRAPAFQLWIGSMAALGLGALGPAKWEEKQRTTRHALR